MKVDKNFNRRGAALVEVSGAMVSTGLSSALGVRITMFAKDSLDGHTSAQVLRIHLTPDESRKLARDLDEAAEKAEAY